jgi:hypothetical protein
VDLQLVSKKSHSGEAARVLLIKDMTVIKKIHCLDFTAAD